MVIVGIDPGSERCGYGAVEETNGALRPIDYGLIATQRSIKPAQRLLHLYDALRERLTSVTPDLFVVERLFFSRNRTSAISVGEARGVVLLAAAQQGLTVCEYTPAEVKQAVCGYGNADKRQVARMVRTLLALESEPHPDDVADALAVAICGAQRARFERMLS